jgi:putative hydrolase of the HAD superfamily
VAEKYPHTLLVDLDDTVIDYGGSAVPSWRAVCEWVAGQAPGLQADALYAAIDRVRRWFWSDPERHREGRADLRAASCRIVEHALEELGCHRVGLARAIAERYRDLRDAAVHVFPGAVGALEQLRARGIRLGLVTNGTGPDQRAKIERFELARHFDHILIEGEFGCGKPDLRVYRAAMEALSARPEDTWFVGDNLEWDVAAPQRLGLCGVWVDRARAGLPTGTTVQPDRIIQALAELT